VPGRCRRAHQADSPSLALELAEGTTDLQAMVGEQSSPDGGFVDSLGSPYQRKGREALRLLHGQLETQCLETTLEQQCLLAVSSVPGFESFFENESALHAGRRSC